nr:hypothetical protein [uncultured bacterium]
MSVGKSFDSVEQDMFTVLHGQSAPVVTRWTYTSADPFAVGLAIRIGPDRWVEWLVARDLVVEGLEADAGEGDIRLSPQVVQGYDIVEIEIRSTDGRAVLEVDRDLLRHFVATTIDLVAPGHESASSALEEELARITAGSAG